MGVTGPEAVLAGRVGEVWSLTEGGMWAPHPVVRKGARWEQSWGFAEAPYLEVPLL